MCGEGRDVKTDQFISIVAVHLHSRNFRIEQEVMEVRRWESEA